MKQDVRINAVQATMTGKGRVTFPKPIRDKLHSKPGDGIEFMLEEDGSLRITPVTASVTRLKGMAPRPGSPIGLEAMDEAVARAVMRRR